MSQEEQNRSFPSPPVAQRSIRDRVGIFIEATRAADAISKIRAAEQAGVQQVWGQSPGFADILTIFTAAAPQTEQIRLGTAIIPTYPRHPMELAQQATVVNDLAPRRLRLGIGPGTSMLIEDWYGLSQTSPLLHLKEYLEVMRGVLWKKKTAYHGRFFNVSNDNFVATLMTGRLPIVRIPLLISAVGPKAFRLAGEIADGALTYLCPVSYLLEVALPALRTGAKARQRPVPPLIAHVPVALSTDEPAVMAPMHQWMQGAALAGAYARMFAHAGFPGVVDGDQEEIDALARTLIVSGDRATVRNRLQELLTSGLDELMLQLVPIVDETSEREQLFRLVGSL